MIKVEDFKPGIIIRGNDKRFPESWNGYNYTYEILSVDWNDNSAAFKLIKDTGNSPHIKLGMVYYYCISQAYRQNGCLPFDILLQDNRTNFGKFINDIYIKEKENGTQ